MAIASVNSVTILIKTWVFMIMFYFAGCAAGSCLSYGHSCWGAHGKRSGHNNNYIVPSKTMNDLQQDAPTFTKEQWILSRLIDRPSMSNKYKERWDRFFKIKSHFPEQIDDSMLNIRLIDDELIRKRSIILRKLPHDNCASWVPIFENHKNNVEHDSSKKRNVNEVQDVIENINDDEKQIPEILLLSANEGNENGGQLRNMELYKVLSVSNDNFD